MGAAQSGVGANIAGIDGSSWGRVVGEDDTCWRLSSGRIAKKDTEGQRWNWCKEEISVEPVAPEKSDMIFVKGLGDRTRVGYSVVNSEYIAFHPHQCLPLYEIEYQLRWTKVASFADLLVHAGQSVATCDHASHV